MLPVNLIFVFMQHYASNIMLSLKALNNWSDLDLFYGKVNFGNLGYFMGKSENSRFFQKLLQPVT